MSRAEEGLHELMAEVDATEDLERAGDRIDALVGIGERVQRVVRGWTPSHARLIEVLAAGDDRDANVLVLNRVGDFGLATEREAKIGSVLRDIFGTGVSQPIAVQHAAWPPGFGYVGPTSTADAAHVARIYEAMLAGWMAWSESLQMRSVRVAEWAGPVAARLSDSPSPFKVRTVIALADVEEGETCGPDDAGDAMDPLRAWYDSIGRPWDGVTDAVEALGRRDDDDDDR